MFTAPLTAVFVARIESKVEGEGEGGLVLDGTTEDTYG
jgi:hypothetical protein